MPFPCPKCGTASMVSDSRGAPGGTRRRYKCLGGHRFSTLEQLADNPARTGSRSGLPLITGIKSEARREAITEMRVAVAVAFDEIERRECHAEDSGSNERPPEGPSAGSSK